MLYNILLIHLVPDPTVAGSCDGVFCIAEKQPVFHPELSTCTCEWIPGLEPAPTVAKKSIVAKQCKDILCIAEQHPVFHPELNACTCDWIPGLEPGGSPVDSRSVPPLQVCPLIKCPAGFNLVFHPETGCSCEPSSK